MDPEKALIDFGLTKAEAALYLVLLMRGEGTASELSHQTNTNRTFTYDRLKKLVDCGLVSHVVKDTRKYFRPADPGHLLALAKEKQEQIASIVPLLLKMKAVEGNGPKVEIFSSHKGIRTVLAQCLKEKGEILIHGSLVRFRDVMGPYYELWNQQRVNSHIKVKVLTDELVDLGLCELDLVGEEEKSSLTTFTAGNKTIIVLWSAVPVAILLEGDEIAKDHRNQFYRIWERELKIYSGVEGIFKAWLDLVSSPSKELVGYGLSWQFAQIYGREYSNEWHQVRLKNDIPARLISYSDEKSHKYFDVRMMEWKKFDIRFIDKDMCGPICVALSDHSIATFLYTEKKLRIVVSKNKEMISIYRRHFEMLWKKSVKS